MTDGHIMDAFDDSEFIGCPHCSGTGVLLKHEVKKPNHRLAKFMAAITVIMIIIIVGIITAGLMFKFLLWAFG